MRVLRGTLTFVLGMVIGIVLFVLAIGGTVAIIGTQITVGRLQSSITSTEVIAPDSELYNKTILDAVQGVISDVQNFDKLSLKTLYEHYGIKLLNGISGIDFTDKEFYSVPIPDLVNDLSIIVNSFTLKDVSKIAGVDFESYGLPVLTDNLDNNLSTAIDNILGSLDGDLSIRAIKDKFGIDIGIDDNKLIAQLQDVVLSEFGNVMNVLRVNSILEADTDTFIPADRSKLQIFVKADRYEEISASDLSNLNNYKPNVDVSLIGGRDSDGDGVADKMNLVETRYIKKSVVTDGVTTDKYVVDNSSYKSDFNFDNNTQTFYRHVIFDPTQNTSDPNAYYLCYANRIDALNGNSFTLVEKGLYKATELNFADDIWQITDTEITKDSKLSLTESLHPSAPAYLRVHKGSSEPLIQRIAHLTIAELQNTDNLLRNITIGDVITINENSATILISLKNSTLGTIGEDIRHLTIDQIIDTSSPDTSPIIKALAKHECTIDDFATITNELTLGELIDVNFDVYEEMPEGEFAFMPFFVKYNRYIHEDEQRYNLVEGNYIADANGDFVKSGYYTLYNDTMGDVTRYDLVTAGDSIIMQSLARRACTINDLGTIMDNLYMSEILRVDGDSAHLFKSLVKRNCTLGEFDTVVDDLEIGEIIVIAENSARIMQSLAARHCTIGDLGTVADELTLAEMIDITSDDYAENINGKYVRLEDETSYTLYDENDAKYAQSTRYTKNADGTFVEDENGSFVHGVYYTLYNPALHGSKTRYDRTENPNASSALLQRFASATLGGFSNSFDTLMLSDVLTMDADVYAEVNLEYVENNEQERYFYYDGELDLFRVIHVEDIKKDPSAHTIYHIAQSGDSTAIMKKLAFVKIDNMSAAMEKAVDDMMLSEFIKVYTENAVDLGTFDGSFDENAKYFIEYGAGGNAYTVGDSKFVYVYDIYGDYAKANFRPVPLEGDINTNTIYYEYIAYSTIEASQYVSKVAELTAKGNLYYYNYDTKTYERNMVLCTYMLTHPSGKYLDQLYFRQTKAGASAADVDNKTVFAGEVYSYTGASAPHGVFVRDNFRGYLPHIEDDPAFADKPLYTFEKSQSGMEYFVDKDDVQKLANALSGQGFESSGIYVEYKDGHKIEHDYGVFYARRECEYVYVLAENGGYVYVDGQYVPYDGAIHTNTDIQRFERKTGYVATVNEISITENGTRITEFEINPITELIREKSSPVLRTLARGTISELTGIINNATIGDIIEAEPGSLFDNESIKKSKISEIGNVLGDLLTNMTIGDLMDWSHVTKVDEYVRVALEDVTIQTLFSSLKLNETTHEITVDMFSIYGYDPEAATDPSNP